MVYSKICLLAFSFISFKILYSSSITFKLFLTTNSYSKDLRSPIIADNNEIFPDATSPIMQTKEPFFTFKLIERRQIYESKVLSWCSFFLIYDDSSLLVTLSSKSILSLSEILLSFCYSNFYSFPTISVLSLFFFSSS